MGDKEMLIQIFEHAVNKAWGEGFDYIVLSPRDGKKILKLLKGQEAFINRLYHEIKARWNIRRQMPDASGDELKFLVDLLDRMEADGDEQEPPKEGDSGR